MSGFTYRLYVLFYPIPLVFCALETQNVEVYQSQKGITFEGGIIFLFQFV